MCYMLIVSAHERLKPKVMRDRVRRGRKKERSGEGEIKGSGKGFVEALGANTGSYTAGFRAQACHRDP